MASRTTWTLAFGAAWLAACAVSFDEFPVGAGGAGGTGASGGLGGQGAQGGALGGGGAGPNTGSLGAPCVQTENCDPGLECWLPTQEGAGPQGGLCTVACNDDNDCNIGDVNGFCADFPGAANPSYCVEGCTYGGMSDPCHGRHNAGCAPSNAFEGITPGVDACLPWCDSAEDCPGRFVCSRRTGLCEELPGPDGNLIVGAQCDPAGTDECRGRCVGSDPGILRTCEERCIMRGNASHCGGEGTCTFLFADIGGGNTMGMLGGCARVCQCNSLDCEPPFTCQNLDPNNMQTGLCDTLDDPNDVACGLDNRSLLARWTLNAPQQLMGGDTVADTANREVSIPLTFPIGGNLSHDAMAGTVSANDADSGILGTIPAGWAPSTLMRGTIELVVQVNSAPTGPIPDFIFALAPFGTTVSFGIGVFDSAGLRTGVYVDDLPVSTWTVNYSGPTVVHVVFDMGANFVLYRNGIEATPILDGTLVSNLGLPELGTVVLMNRPDDMAGLSGTLSWVAIYDDVFDQPRAAAHSAVLMVSE